ncbi:hypothetical protein [Spongiactinospora sp. TRM90649]|uniref:hypothetical protein n=1 Tax=Spongiactinospora sp. TRM90649 TaxID=3031114 RepID=UPI0023F96EF6|nr:hypothetical protein [Spongiactinospora sp. TRM90649]MDF5758376.1 hypothetical protein [Spongiactinospora sp. TRM90649]
MATRVDSNSYLTDEQKQVYQLRVSLERNGGTPVGFLDLLAAVVEDNTWQKIPSGVNHDRPFDVFSDFIEAKPPFGLDSQVQHVRTLLQLRHPNEGVPHIRERMERMRRRVTELLGPDPEHDPITRDAQGFGAYAEYGCWLFALMVARSARNARGGSLPGAPVSDPNDQPERPSTPESGKVSFTAFAERAGCDVGRVSRYFKAWERAAQAGIVPPAAKLRPGQEVALPAPETWAAYFTFYETSNDKRQQLAAEAEAIGTSYKKAVEITSNRPAMRAAILGDPQTAEAARDALLERPEARAAVMAQALADPVLRKEAAVETRRAERAEYVQRVLTEGKAKSPGGQLVELSPEARENAANHLAVVQDSHASADAVTESYEFVQNLIAEVVQADPDLLIREQRTKLSKTLHNTVKSIQSIDPDDLLAFADDSLVIRVTELQQKVNDLAALIVRRQ